MNNHPSNRVTRENIHDVFTYHAPSDKQVGLYKELRAAAEDFAATILTCCPDCADRATAIRKVREAVMTANSAIALDLY